MTTAQFFIIIFGLCLSAFTLGATLAPDPNRAFAWFLAGLALTLTLFFLASCGRGPACPHLVNGGSTPAPPTCPVPR